jgi:hypothetical protein
MTSDQDSVAFQHSPGFAPAAISGMLGLGPLEEQYQELFVDVLEDGVITAEERAQLERAASNLGLDRQRLLKLEHAMVSAYEAHHQVRIVEEYEQPARSLAPVDLGADQLGTRDVLLGRIQWLERRVHELEVELRRAQSALQVEVDLTDLDRTVDVAREDADSVWRRVRGDPLGAGAHRELYRIYAARGDEDRAWCSAQALVALGAADQDQTERFERHRLGRLCAPKAGVGARDWVDHLMHPELELVTSQLFGAIVAAVLVGRVSALRRDHLLQPPDPTTRQEPAKSTVMAVRALPWAASVLGLGVPPIYLDKERDAGFLHVPGVPPTSVIGRQVLTGRSELEHAFLAGRHLTWYRQELYIKTLFSGVPDLEDLFLAALTVGNPALPIAEDRRRRVAPIAEAIEPLLDAEQVDGLRGLYLQFVEEGGRTNLGRWSQSAEKTACRAGLVLCGDLGTALALLEAEEGIMGELGRDLIAFSVSERYFALRAALGLGVGQS